MRTEINMEKFDPAKHDLHRVASLIYTVDPELNSMVYGNEAAGTAVIKRMLQMDYGYFAYPHVHCAGCEGEVVGVLAGYDGKTKKELEKTSGKAFVQAFGIWPFLKRLPTLIRISNFTWKIIDDDGYFVNILCLKPSHRGHGAGTGMLKPVLEKYNSVYLDVNINNERAQKFYAGLGFKIQAKNTIMYKGKRVGTYSLLYQKADREI